MSIVKSYYKVFNSIHKKLSIDNCKQWKSPLQLPPSTNGKPSFLCVEGLHTEASILTQIEEAEHTKLNVSQIHVIN
jgi:hypothetical protein